MLPAVVAPACEDPQTLIREDAIQARHYFCRQLSAETLVSYKSDWSIFGEWCQERRLKQLPAEAGSIALFLSNQAAAGLKASTITRRKAAIRYHHNLAGVDPCPTDCELVKATMKGIRRSIGQRSDPKAPVTVDMLKSMLQYLPDTIAGVRDRAILLLGFAGAFRRSELASLMVDDLVPVAEGIRVIIRRSKTDQEGEGQIVPIIKGKVACPVKAIAQWLKIADIKCGPIFRRIYKGGHLSQLPMAGQSISRVVKIYTELAGYDPKQFAGHSLRSGFLTSAAMKGASIFKMMTISRHKSVQTLQFYVRMAEEFKDHAGDGLL